MMKLDTPFYAQNVVEVAKSLIGKVLVFEGFEGLITETEAYRGSDDPASHAFRGITPRSKIMFGPPGYTYVYLIYGMYHCLNVVAESEGQGAAVLIRGLKLSDAHLDGPGKLCRHLGITKAHQGINLILNHAVYIKEGIPLNYQATPRIGIQRGLDKLWRFVADNC